MRACLLSISLLCALMAQAQVLPHDDGDTRRYAVTLDIRQATVTGLLIMKQEGDSLLGTLINEFGMRAFDLVADRRRDKVKLMDVMPLMDKWYIRRLIRADLRTMIRYDSDPTAKVPRHREITRSDSTLTLRNTRYQIGYSFTLLPPTQSDDTER